MFKKEGFPKLYKVARDPQLTLCVADGQEGECENDD